MKPKAFVDTDVIIDFLVNREPYLQNATLLFDLADKRKIKLYTSSICLNNVHYICRKVLGEKKSRLVITELLEIIDVVSVSGKEIEESLKSDFKDFEDGLQHATAISNNEIKSIITRNIKDFKSSTLPVLTPDNFLASLENG